MDTGPRRDRDASPGASGGLPELPAPSRSLPNPLFGWEPGPGSGLKGAFLTVAALGAYMAVFPSADGWVGHGALALYTVPLLAAGWTLGMAGGFLVGLLFLPVNTLLLNFAGGGGLLVLLDVGAGPAVVTCALLGAAIGRLRDLREEVRAKARELSLKHEALKQESRDRKAVERQLLMLMRVHEEVLESVPAGVLQMDPEGTVTYQNHFLREVLGLYRSPSEGGPAWNVFQSEAFQAHPALMDAVRDVLAGEAFDDFELSWEIDGEDRAFSVSGVPVVETVHRRSGPTYKGGVLLVRSLRRNEPAAAWAASNPASERAAHN